MTKPTIHLNGDTPESLLEGYRTAMEGISNAQHSMHAAWPNARNYYPQGPEAVQEAIREHAVRLQKLDDIHAELLELAMHCNSIIEARRAERNVVLPHGAAIERLERQHGNSENPSGEIQGFENPRHGQ